MAKGQPLTMATAEEKAGGSWQSKLEKEGYAVLKGVLTKSEVDTARLVPYIHKRRNEENWSNHLTFTFKGAFNI